eukprot:331339_1
MNGGNSSYHNHDHKKRRLNNGHSVSSNNDNNENENTNSANHNTPNRQNNDDFRDESLPPQFHPKNGCISSNIFECFGLFLQREQLGRDNLWYCKKCKELRQGMKKLDLWWLPSRLIIAIKRFDNH